MSKQNEGKPEYTLVYKSLMEGVAKVRRFGIEKHGNSEDWRSTESVRHYDALLRHIFAFIEGEEFDKESGLSHLYHAATNIMFEIETNYGGEHVNIVRNKTFSDLNHVH